MIVWLIVWLIVLFIYLFLAQEFQIINSAGGKKCIQFKMNDQKCALKVIKGKNPVKTVFEVNKNTYNLRLKDFWVATLNPFFSSHREAAYHTC